MLILVTGATGRLGRTLISRLVECARTYERNPENPRRGMLCKLTRWKHGMRSGLTTC